MNNVILIGMPGSGKTYVSHRLAEVTGLALVDFDSYLEAVTRTTIPEWFEKGEEVFRDVESLCCKVLAYRRDAIFSTGGGIILREENMAYLKASGTVIFLHRDLETMIKEVNITNRPLLKDGPRALIALYEKRRALYIASADVVIDHRNIDDTLRQIIPYCPARRGADFELHHQL